MSPTTATGRDDTTTRWPGWQTIAFAAILLGYIALLFHNLAANTVWNDEGMSYLVAVDGVHQTLLRIARDTHAPLYYVVLSLWLKLGHGEFAFRSLSVFAAIVAIVFVYLSARILTGRNIALVAMLLFAISPDNISWSQHARPYALQTMFVAISFWGFVQILMSPAARGQLIGRGVTSAIRSGRASEAAPDLAWFAYAAAGGLAMLAQHPAGFFVFGCNVAIAVIVIQDIARQRTLLINWIAAQIVLIAIWLIWLPQFLGQISEHMTLNQMETHQRQFLVSTIWPEFVSLLSVTDIWRLQPWPLALYVPLFFWGWYKAVRTRADIRWIYLAAVSPLAATTIGYYLISPLFGYAIEVLHWFLVLYAIGVAYGIAAVPTKPLRIIALAALALLNLRGLSNYYQTGETRYDQIAQVIEANARPGDGIIFEHRSCRLGLAYYMMHSKWMDMPGFDRSLPGDNLIRTVPSAAANARNWVCVPENATPEVSFAELEGIGTLAFEQHFSHFILRRYDRRN